MRRVLKHLSVGSFQRFQMNQVPLIFNVHATAPEPGLARASTLTLLHGPIQTPVFMPVGTQVLKNED